VSCTACQRKTWRLLPGCILTSSVDGSSLLTEIKSITVLFHNSLWRYHVASSGNKLGLWKALESWNAKDSAIAGCPQLEKWKGMPQASRGYGQEICCMLACCWASTPKLSPEVQSCTEHKNSDLGCSCVHTYM